jgi:hypothetical protein
MGGGCGLDSYDLGDQWRAFVIMVMNEPSGFHKWWRNSGPLSNYQCLRKDSLNGVTGN